MPGRDLFSALSEGLLSDDRVLSASDRELLRQLLLHTQRSDSSNGAVATTLAHAVGQLISERASAILGKQLFDQLLEPGSHRLNLGTPSPPNPGDLPPHPPAPGPPTTQPSATREVPRAAVDSFILLDEFLAPAELSSLTDYVLKHEADFRVSEVISPGVPGGMVDFDSRRSRVLMDTGTHGTTITERLRTALPRLLDRLAVEPFAIRRIETQITASNHGDFFRWHTDSGTGDIASREITFVYFFHREPKTFQGGELRIYESTPQAMDALSAARFETIVPEQNQMVIFRSFLAHEILPIDCPGAAFADSRFTVNGWLHR